MGFQVKAACMSLAPPANHRPHSKPPLTAPNLDQISADQNSEKDPDLFLEETCLILKNHKYTTVTHDIKFFFFQKYLHSFELSYFLTVQFVLLL